MSLKKRYEKQKERYNEYRHLIEQGFIIDPEHVHSTNDLISCIKGLECSKIYYYDE